MGKMMFGADEKIECIVDVGLKGADDAGLCLAHKHTKTFVVAGVWVTDDGYVLGVKGDSTKYYDMPTGEELAGLQQEGLLPDPLPAYSISTWDYLFGYSLWIVVGVMVLWYGAKALLRGSHGPPVTTSVGGFGPPPGESPAEGETDRADEASHEPAEPVGQREGPG